MIRIWRKERRSTPCAVHGRRYHQPLGDFVSSFQGQRFSTISFLLGRPVNIFLVRSRLAKPCFPGRPMAGHGLEAGFGESP